MTSLEWNDEERWPLHERALGLLPRLMNAIPLRHTPALLHGPRGSTSCVCLASPRYALPLAA